MKKIIFAIFILSTFIINAQNELDAIRFSFITPVIGARNAGMGGSFGAIGADFSNAYSNPAGTARFSSVNITISPNFTITTNKTIFNGSEAIRPTLKFNIQDFGVVIPWSINKNSIKNLTFSIGQYTLKDFKETIIIDGNNNKGSMLDYFMNAANGFTPGELNKFNTFLAFDTWLIDTLPNTNAKKYTNPLWFVAPNGPLYGENVLRTDLRSGKIKEFFFNFAINFEKYFQVGATISAVSGLYTHTISHKENNFLDNTDLREFSYIEDLKDELSGINLKIGVIAEPVKFLRIGASYTTPSFLTIIDNYKTSVESFWKTPDAEGRTNYSASSPENIWEYELQTPPIYRINAGIVIAPYVLVGLEYEYIDYRKIRMFADDYAFKKENKAIDSLFTSVNNLRTGLELNFGLVRLRGGVMLLQDYLAKNSEKLFEIMYSGGIGINTNNFFCDLTYITSSHNYQYSLYSGYIDEPMPKVDKKTTNILITLGVKF